MDAQDFYEQSKHQMSEAIGIFKAYSLGEDLTPDQLHDLCLQANELFKVFHEAYEKTQGAE